MYLNPNKAVEDKIYYIVKSFRNKEGKISSRNVCRLGTLEEIRRREGVADPWAWAKSRLNQMNLEESEQRRKVMVPFDPSKIIGTEERRSFNIGYLTLNKLIMSLALIRYVTVLPAEASLSMILMRSYGSWCFAAFFGRAPRNLR